MGETEPKFALVVEFTGGLTADKLLNIGEAWEALRARFGSGSVSLVGAGLLHVEVEPHAVNDDLMNPVWEDIRRQKFELEKRGLVVKKPSDPTHAEFAVWGQVVEELLELDPAGRVNTFKGQKWADRINAALQDRGLGPLVGRENAERRRLYNVIRTVFGDAGVIWNDGSNMYTTLVWKSDVA